MARPRTNRRIPCRIVEFSEVIRRRRMVRSFSGKPVPDALLNRIVAAGRRAPSAGNAQGWSAVILRGPAETSSFWQATTTPDWRAKSSRWAGLSKAPAVIIVLTRPETYFLRYAEADKVSSGLGIAPAQIDAEPTMPLLRAGCHTTDTRTPVLEGPPAVGAIWPVPYWFVDAGFAALLMMLAATDAGLGVCFLGNFRGESELLDTLGAPGGWRYVGAVLAGEPGGMDHPSKSLARPKAADAEVLHWGKW